MGVPIVVCESSQQLILCHIMVNRHKREPVVTFSFPSHSMSNKIYEPIHTPRVTVHRATAAKYTYSQQYKGVSTIARDTRMILPCYHHKPKKKNTFNNIITIFIICIDSSYSCRGFVTSLKTCKKKKKL